jgi:hypothetical protein
MPTNHPGGAATAAPVLGWLEFSIGGFPGGYEVFLLVGRACWSSNGRVIGDPQLRRIELEAADVERFWADIERFGVWDWAGDLNDRGIMDGTQWQLAMGCGSRHLDLFGSNAFPPEESFRCFRIALERLAVQRSNIFEA